jgi:iron uptake system EfeUOB component EfeO/EfeM
MTYIRCWPSTLKASLPHCIMLPSGAILSLSRGHFARNSMRTLANRFPFSRTFSNDDEVPSEKAEWRKQSLDQLERRFAKEPTKLVHNEADLQPEWKAMESRVVKRRTLTLDEVNGKTGRENIRLTEEDVWMESGLYDEGSKNLDDSK